MPTAPAVRSEAFDPSTATDPQWPRRVAAHVALDLRAGHPHTLHVRSLRVLRKLRRALHHHGVAYATTLAVDDAGLAVTFTPRDGAP